MSSSGESASPGVSFSPGFLGAIFDPGLGGGIPKELGAAAAAFLGSSLPALAFSFSSFAFWASCALVGFSIFTGLTGVLAAALAAGFTALTGLPFALAGCDFLAGTDLEAAAFAAVRGLLADALL